MTGAITAGEAASFLSAHHGTDVTEVEPLSGGLWSAAFGYRADGRDLVARFGELREGFDMDQRAHAWAGPDLPIPEVLDVGDAFGGAYAISVRHHGSFLEEVDPADADAAGPAVMRLLAGLRAVPAPPGSPAAWHPDGADPATSTWRAWLRAGLVDDPSHPVHGWRETIARDAALDGLYTELERRVGELSEACPERRDLVHGDLLHQNVLLDDGSAIVTAVFSWKCSVRGDFLFDVAWCTFWGPWHPGIEALDVWGRTLADDRLAAPDLEDAAVRHHCYELQIGASHLGWFAWQGDRDGLRTVADRTAGILERGPLQQR
jgi:aminoglycoside phosphotransferase (APT) family kinase protein